MEKQSHKRLKVLLGCYACDPNRGSEPGMGWNFAYNISKHHDVHAIVEEGEFKESLERFSRENPEAVRNITFHFVPRTHHERLRKIWPPSYYRFYRAWHKKAYQLAKELDKRENFDIVHQVNMAGYREPGYLWKLGKPFIWGPLGGLNNTAWCLLSELGVRDAFFYSLRNIINSWQKRFGYAARMVSQKAHTIFVSDPEGIRTVQHLWNRTPKMMREVGTPNITDEPEPVRHKIDEPLKLCWVGIHEARKALPILLKALPLCNHPMKLEVLGSGEKEKEWKQLATNLGLSSYINFHGFISHSAVSLVMKQCHVMCITSIHEGGTSTVTLEALQNGLPIVALNHCGYATVIDETCGIKLPVQSQKKISAQLAAVLDELAEDEERRMRLARGAIERGKIFTWDAKMQVLNRVYAEAAAGNQVN